MSLLFRKVSLMKLSKRTTIILTSLFIGASLLSSCGVVDAIEDAITADPQKSTCKAYCEWAIACHGAEREVDAEALLESCLTQTKAQNEQCEVMETEGINEVSSALYKDCTDAIDAKKTANDCSPFTGNAVDINSSTVPTECAPVAANDDIDVFNAARLATAESNDQLCDRVSITLCQRSTACLVDEYNIPQSVLDAFMPSAQEQCVTLFDENVTTECRNDDLYSISSEMSDNKADLPSSESALPSVLFSVNASRESARACLAALAQLPCDELFSGQVPPVCAGAFSDPIAAGSTLSSFACGLERDELASVCE
jgi:hypothetical protein